MNFIMAPVAKEKEEAKITTYYLYDQNGNLDKRNKIIYSPFNVKTMGRLPHEDAYIDPKIFEFIGGVFETSDAEDIEALDCWWKGGGILSNKRKFYPDQVHKIKRDKPSVLVNPDKVTERIIEKQVIPLLVLETMTVAQLKQLAQSWEIEIPEELDKGENVKEQIVRMLTEGGHVK